MADPHIKSPMDFWDYLTVIIYRNGFVLAAIMLLLLPFQSSMAQVGLLIAGTMLASSLHLYLKNFRYLFQFVMWIGLLCQVWKIESLAFGASLMVIGGLCYKEYFCFRVWRLNFQPILLAVLWLAVVLQISWLFLPLAILCSILTLFLSVQKWRMPLHFDIGDKGKYQV
ncbi:hypothetical protein F543_17840 [Bibersteinia trehalosi USDA-ARS-USMARC-189]|uniref:Integral membrane protein n=1 Tax=Bibersteinia trehalosi USDA-ARS-USMARC-189 TaxID=1263831 RepID=A0ABM5PEN8_BIBTR|nr:DUF2301 domain-containing membrane protein [Bibersteinia trehalosi]AGH37869.1 hypothetical protein WQG_5900 [Bibersteinia trehalosi USDA-ARS-USMARC-192]AHG84646.1 hypothetical protein F543_17840 [Bibersteinia trehalosi USDA-ARS-USMARC-189]